MLCLHTNIMTIGKKYVTTLEQSSHSNYLKEQATSHSHLIHRLLWRYLLLKKSRIIRWPCFAAVKCVFKEIDCVYSVCSVFVECVWRPNVCFASFVSTDVLLATNASTWGEHWKGCEYCALPADFQIGWTFYFKLTSCTCLWCLWGQSCLLCLYNVVFVATFQSELKIQFVLWNF